MARRHISVYLMLLALALVMSGLFISGGQTSQASSSDRSSDKPDTKEPAKPLATPEVSTAVRFDVSPPLGELMRRNPAPTRSDSPVKEQTDFYGGRIPADNGYSGDGALQKFLGAMAIPTPLVTFDGIANQWNVHPPDPNGDVGPNHYVQMVNLGFRIFDKSGNPLTPVANNNTLWQGFGGPCEVENAGDPIVLHDQLANRWMLTQFSDSGAPFFNCVALSTTADPTGTYYRYAFSAPAFPDYPKYGVWPDAYYLNTREGDTTLGNYALEREQMLIGNPAARVVRFGGGPGFAWGNGLLPSDLDGEDLPPAGSPNYFVGTQDDDGAYGAPFDAINIYEFHVDWANTANSTFTGPTILPVAEFDSNYPCSGRQCIPQPGTTVRVDILSYRQRPTWRAAYRNFGTHESIVTAQSVEAQPSLAGMRWYELRGLNGTPVVYQQGTYAPDTIIHRWMGSIAMDGSGNMALGYSVSNGVDVYPGLRFTGRLASDPLGTMPQGEGIMKVGTGSQTSTGARWGDYTSMTVDPSDDCTFWYTNQFIPTTSSVGWRGAVGAFKFPGCTGSGGTPTPTVTGTPPTNTPTNTPTHTPTATNTVPVPSDCNPQAITIPDSGPGSPYPSLISVSGGGTIVDVDVTLNDLTHTYADDIDILLVGPGGQSVILMSDAGGSNGVTDVDLTFDDEAAGTLPDSGQIVSGSYDPTNYGTADTFPAPAPGPPYGTTMSVFDGTNPNGNWSLYVVDDLGGDSGDIGGGWCLNVTIGGTPTYTPAATCVPGGTPTWVQGPAYTPGVYAVQGGVSSSNGNFYIAGGQDATNVSLPNVNRFDPATNTFTALAPLPVAVGQGAVGAAGNKVYVAGGYISGTTITSTLQIYDIPSNTWSFGASMPAAVEAAAGVIHNNKFYVIGGDNFTAVVATNYIYDIATNTWSTGAALPAGRSNLNGTAVGNYIYTAGGVIGAGFDANDALLRYDPAANSWTTLAPYGVTGYGNYAGISPYATNTKLFVLAGGDTGFEPINRTRIYDIATNTWTEGPVQLEPRMAHAQGTLQDGRVIVVSGYTGSDTYTTSNLLVPGGGGCPSPTVGTPTTNTPTPTATATTCVAGGVNVIVDGSFEGGTPNAAWDEGSTNFGTPLCDEASCGTGGGTAGPRTGDWWAWFGGIQAVEDAFVSQSVNIPAGSQATLQFYLWIGAHSGGGTADYVRVTVGGTEVFRATDANTEYDAGYTLVTVDVSAQAGGARIVRIESHNGDVGVFNASVDDVTLNVGGGCPSPTTGLPTSTSTATPGTPGTSTPTPTACTLEFTDVPVTNTFYPFVRCLACQGIISGYPCGGDFEPCDPDNNPYFRPNNYVTRGQLSKIVSESADFNEPIPSTQQSFEDVIYGSPFWEYVERLYGRGIIGGYQCGVDPNEPCIPPDNRPYFRPNNGATRGQLTKIVSEAAGFTDVIPDTQQTFTDVPPGHTFWLYIERLLLNRPEVMSGYPCGQVPSEPCDSENRPYFRPNNPLTRGQTSKIVANTFFPGCNPPRP